eukprot:g7173.t1
MAAGPAAWVEVDLGKRCVIETIHLDWYARANTLRLYRLSEQEEEGEEGEDDVGYSSDDAPVEDGALSHRLGSPQTVTRVGRTSNSDETTSRRRGQNKSLSPDNLRELTRERGDRITLTSREQEQTYVHVAGRDPKRINEKPGGRAGGQGQQLRDQDETQARLLRPRRENVVAYPYVVPTGTGYPTLTPPALFPWTQRPVVAEERSAEGRNGNKQVQGPQPSPEEMLRESREQGTTGSSASNWVQLLRVSSDTSSTCARRSASAEVERTVLRGSGSTTSTLVKARYLRFEFLDGTPAREREKIETLTQSRLVRGCDLLWRSVEACAVNTTAWRSLFEAVTVLAEQAAGEDRPGLVAVCALKGTRVDPDESKGSALPDWGDFFHVLFPNDADVAVFGSAHTERKPLSQRPAKWFSAGGEFDFRNGAAGRKGSGKTKAPAQDPRENIGHACLKGKKADPNQDNFFAISFKEQKNFLLGVFDGHGPKGEAFSEIGALWTPLVVMREVENSVAAAGAGAGSSSCDSRALVIETVCRSTSTRLHKLTALTKDHKPEADEADRLRSGWASGENSIGFIRKQRVWFRCDDDLYPPSSTSSSSSSSTASGGGGAAPASSSTTASASSATSSSSSSLAASLSMGRSLGGLGSFFYGGGGRANSNSAGSSGTTGTTAFISGLNMSRSLGDRYAHEVGVSSEPETRMLTVDLRWEVSRSFEEKSVHVLLATDGVFEVMSNEEVAEAVVELLNEKKSTQQIAQAVAATAAEKWSGHYIDDITVVLYKV